jgi:hypothetical protein
MELATPTVSTKAASLRFWYGTSIAEFAGASVEKIVGQMTLNSSFDIDRSQAAAWLTEIEFLQSKLSDLAGSIFFEFNIPRMGRRIDVVLLIGPVVFAVEFKVGEKTFDRSAIEQVWDYGLDLKNFHEASHNASIIPILIATEATECPQIEFEPDADKLYRPIVVDPEKFRSVLDAALTRITGSELSADGWSRASYHPRPTIIEAARSLYAHHSVEAIDQFDAGEQNLGITSRRVEELVDDARAKSLKRICFVTGVPGAGKTLVGLNLATRREENQPTHAVYLSGNDPLVKVLRAALTRDELARQKGRGKKVRKGEVEGPIKSFIQNVHHFRDEGIVDSGPPDDHVVIFDEAQRGWNQKKAADFMLRRKKRPGFSMSEPEFLISYMDRRQDWAVIVCLVGGGQEIHTGEAGIGAWLEAVDRQFPEWEMFISSRLTDREYAAGRVLEIVRQRARTHFDDSLHLAVSMRSFRAENVSAFVKALLDCDKAEAKKTFAELSARYPIAITRDLNAAKRWIRERARGSERYGLVASSKAMRLKPHAIDIRVSVDPVQYFLNDRHDTRSSWYLEDAATEFQVQGLELDWVCVNWDADFRFNGAGWDYHDFRGDRWCNISNADNRNYLRNAYRVLLTRARQGMVVFIPPGESADATRSPAFYDLTFTYLTELGICEIA